MGLFEIVGYANFHHVTVDNKGEHYIAELNLNVRNKYDDSRGSQTTTLRVPLNKREYDLLKKQMTQSEFPNTYSKRLMYSSGLSFAIFERTKNLVDYFGLSLYLKVNGEIGVALAHPYEFVANQKTQPTRQQIQEKIKEIVESASGELAMEEIEDLARNADKTAIVNVLGQLLDQGSMDLTEKKKWKTKKKK